MPQSQYRARQVGAKTHEVVEYDHDETKPGKPLHILIPGGLVALGALAVIVLIIYLTWFEGQLNQTTGIVLIAILFPFYVGGVFLFSYGYELYNIPRAIRLTAIIVFFTLAAVVIVAVLFFVLAGGGKIPGGSSEKKSSGGGSKVKADVASSSSSSSGSGFPDLGNVVVLGNMGRRTHTREVIKETTVEVPVSPRSINCPSCNRGYVPADEKYICPSCGAPTPKELIDESQEPRNRE
ncbi:MAG TPA: hypothetical protein DCX53_09135 [Anaerolineae bacterium]|nr:hypothetical protein [Anaerolineae bacterium]